MALMDYVKENMHRGEKINWEVGFPQSHGILAIQMFISALTKDFEVVFISG